MKKNDRTAVISALSAYIFGNHPIYLTAQSKNSLLIIRVSINFQLSAGGEGIKKSFHGLAVGQFFQKFQRALILNGFKKDFVADGIFRNAVFTGIDQKAVARRITVIAVIAEIWVDHIT